MTRAGALGLMATVAIVGSACESADVAGDRAGNPAEPTVVTIITEEIHPTPTLLLELLSQHVDEVSDGSVRLDVQTTAIDGGEAWDQATIELADTGAADGVLVRAGSWRSFGVATLDVLQLPGVVETDDQADRVAADEALVDDLLAGLAQVGYTGLGLYPEGPRYLMLLDDSTSFSLGALAGRKVRSPLSDTVFDVLAATGMQPVDVSPQDFVASVESGDVTATEGHVERVSLTVTDDGKNDSVMATNLTLYTKFVVLAIRTDSVTPEVMDVLRQAARAAVPDFTAQRTREHDALRAACDAGGVLVTMPDAEREALFQAMMPVVDAVAQGPSAALFTRVRSTAGVAEFSALTCGDSAEAAAVTTTAPPATAPGAVPTSSLALTLPIARSEIVPTAGDLPNGVYRFTQTVEDLLAADPGGSYSPSDEFIGEFVLKDGTSEIHYFNMDATPMAGEPPDTGGTYQVQGDLMIFATPPERTLPGTNGIHLLRWSFRDDTLTLQQIDGKPVDPDFTVVWTRVADAP